MPLDLSAGPTPPPATKRKPGPGRPPGAASAKAAEAKKNERAEGLNGIFQITTFGLMMTGQVADAGAVSIHGPTISGNAAELADQDARIAKIIDYITAAGPYMALLSVSMPLVLQIMVNHGRIPESAIPALSQVGVMSPAAMENKARAEAMKLETQMRNAALEAEQELRDAMAAAERPASENGRPRP
jgi:hypothetical protein